MEICQEHIGGESIAATLVAAGKSILAAVPIPLGSGVVFFLARRSAVICP
jgi:hypothetical protein